MQDKEFLKQQFAIKGQLDFEQHESGLIFVTINNHYAKAKISTYAGHVLSFQPHDCGEDLFFLSDKAVFRQGKAIRGGIPVCWPWFGNDNSGLGRPSHGFARNQLWDVIATEQHADDSTSVTLQLTDSEESLALWPYRFELTLKVTVGKVLTVSMTTRNTGNRVFAISQALHSYFNISDVENIHISGLDAYDYLDKLDKFKQKKQQGVIKVDQELDRIYQNVPATVSMTDTGLARKIEIATQAAGELNTVIWNPWKKSVKGIRDLANTDYRQFVCIETANAMEHSVRIEAGSSYEISATYRLSAI